MFSEYLKQTNQKSVEYFENLLSKYSQGKNNIPNSIILWGSDCLAQYFFALEIARNLNCKNNGDINCDCISCNWIRTNTNPEIKTVSKIDSKPDGDETKVISIKQVQNLINELSVKSEDYRVAIFCDADFEKLSADKISHLDNFKELKSAIREIDGKYWQPKPLSLEIFREEAENALLKTIEETPKNVTFIFLTASPEDIIPTIISRSQMFYIRNTFQPKYDYDFCKEVFKDFPQLNKEDFDIFTSKSQDYMKTNELDVQNYLELIQAYFTELLLTNYKDPQVKEKILSVINYVIQAKKYDMASIKPQYIFDDLWINLS